MKKIVFASALLLAGVWAYAQSEVAPVAPSPPRPAPAASRSGAPAPYSAPVSVPSAAGQIGASRIPVPNVTVNVPPRPAFTSSCDSGGCWGSDGARYNSVGGSLVSPNGKICQSVGGVLQCP